MLSFDKMLKEMEIDINDLQNSHNKICRVIAKENAFTDTAKDMFLLAGTELTLNEVESPVPYHFYDYVNIDAFSWQRGSDSLQLDVYTSFIEEKREIQLIAHFLDAQTQQHFADVELQSASHTSIFTSSNEISLADTFGNIEMDSLAVIVECKILDALGRTTHLLILKELHTTEIIFSANNFGLSPTYTHIYPKKEAQTIIFDKGIIEELPKKYPKDENNIVISLRRAPTESGDSDYVCNYNSNHYYPYLAIPAKGVIQLGRSVHIDPVRNRMAYLEKISSGGVAPITAQTFVADIIDKGTLQFELQTNWQTLLKQQGQLVPQTYHFMLSFDVDYKLPSGNMQTLTFLMSSKVNTAIRSGTCIQEPLLPLKIMWGCLAADTLITMADGQTNRIADVRPGDQILSGKERKIAMVENAWRGTEENIICIDTENGVQLSATHEHPLLVKTDTGECYKPARQLMPGDYLYFSDPAASGWKKVVNVEVIPYGNIVYNLSLQNSDGFYANGILVGDMDTQNARRF